MQILRNLAPQLGTTLTFGCSMAAVAGSLALPLSAGGAGTTECASLTSAGVQGNGNSYWGNGPSDRYISADGRFVAFRSESSNLAPGDTNGQPDVFLRDMLTGTTQRVSVSSTGVQGDGASALPSISADGRYVAFESDATNLVAGDTNGWTDVFVRDRVAGTTELVSLSSAGVQANCQSSRPSINADGRFVAFTSCTTNWIPGKVQALNDVFVRDRLLSTTEWVNPPLSGGANNNHHSGTSSISDDGRYVTYASLANTLAVTSFNTLYSSQIYTRDRSSATTEWTSVCSYVSGEASDSYEPSISGDGRFVAYESDSTTAVANDTNGYRDIFVRDRQAATTERVNVSSSGAQAVTVGPSVSVGTSSHGSISRDGRYVAFDSCATNLDPADALPFNFQDVFVRDRLNGTTTLASVSNAGAPGSSSSENPAISADGQSIAFASFATNFMPSDTNFAPDIFVRSYAAQCYCTAGTSTNGCVPAISATGHASASVSTGFTLSLANLEGQKSGLFFYGLSGPIASPWGSSSVLCVKAPTQRMLTHNSGGTAGACDGTLSEDWNAFIASTPTALGQPFSGGETVSAQAWYRDPPSSKTTALSNALTFTVEP